MEKKKYAKVSWNTVDILDLKPNWTEDQAEEFLSNNEHHIQDAMVQAGWEAIDTLLSMEED